LWYQVGNPTTLNVEETNNVSSQLKVYPNPVDDFVYVSLSNQSAQYQYRILDLSGRIMQQGFLDSNKINCSTLQSSLYLLTIFSQSESYSIKFVKD
jgi:hypothetical protein